MVGNAGYLPDLITPKHLELPPAEKYKPPTSPDAEQTGQTANLISSRVTWNPNVNLHTSMFIFLHVILKADTADRSLIALYKDL